MVCRTRAFAPSASAGAFYAAPENPSRVLSKVGGVDVLFQSTPRRCVPPPRLRSAPPPEGAAPLRLPPRDSPFTAGGQKRGRGQQLPLKSLAACVPPPDARAAALAALMLALPPSPRLRWDKPVACAPVLVRTCAVSIHGTRSLPCGLRARGRPARIIAFARGECERLFFDEAAFPCS